MFAPRFSVCSPTQTCDGCFCEMLFWRGLPSWSISMTQFSTEEKNQCERAVKKRSGSALPDENRLETNGDERISFIHQICPLAVFLDSSISALTMTALLCDRLWFKVKSEIWFDAVCQRDAFVLFQSASIRSTEWWISAATLLVPCALCRTSFRRHIYVSLPFNQFWPFFVPAFVLLVLTLQLILERPHRVAPIANLADT